MSSNSLEAFNYRRQELMQDPQFFESLQAWKRLMLNGAVAGVDCIPVAGDLFSWYVDGCKWISRLKKEPIGIQKKFEKWNLTPDVPMAVTVASEVLELLPFIPSGHLIEMGIQGAIDYRTGRFTPAVQGLKWMIGLTEAFGNHSSAPQPAYNAAAA